LASIGSHNPNSQSPERTALGLEEKAAQARRNRVDILKIASENSAINLYE
jgi:hypothetical protein